MYQVHQLKWGHPHTFTEHPTFPRAEAEFNRCVEYFADGHKPSRTGIQIRDGNNHVIREFVVPRKSDMADDIAVRFGFKIHGFHTANGTTRSANTQKFYESEDEATLAAERCMKRPNGDGDGIVIYKAIKLVRRKTPPIEIEEIAL